MDYQNRVGSKFGGGGMASHSVSNADRRERLRKLALESIDLSKDPYFFRNHVGTFECRLCLTVHQNDGSYLAHTQGKKHQTNLAMRAARETKLGKEQQAQQQQKNALMLIAGEVAGEGGGSGGSTGADGKRKRKRVTIGRPGYKITKIRDPVTKQLGLLFQVQFPDIESAPPPTAAASSATPNLITPKWQLMNAFTQRVEEPDKNFQYVLIAAEPYDTVAFKIPNRELDRSQGRQFEFWDPDAREFWLQIMFLPDARLLSTTTATATSLPPKGGFAALPPIPPAPNTAGAAIQTK